ncbi:hypothetical protein [Kineosporia sp. NBRC 101731]|uniref:hypothetical protein n=1 Tax=Kineosporia sp. NBRC 101731 TaxID=3032199 RepID=UPI0024A152B7|nr:hypothetical protein [Kineosporia sp. NBRC 101731]GLY30749.1 hypothetical protein Kisp02_41140 [Kineosporia sp. NBRC 101731]
MPKDLIQSVAPSLAPPVIRRPSGASGVKDGADLSFGFPLPLLPPFAGEGDE